MTRRGVIFDRDATLIDVFRDEETGSITPAFHPKQLRLLSGVVDGLRMLAERGYVLAIATNQPAPAKGQFSREAVERTNAALVAMLADHGVAIAGLECCMHHPDGGPGGDPSLVMRCECRKPRPGMLDALVRDLGLDREASWMVGDSPGDVEAGQAARMKTALVFPSNRCELCPLRGGIEAVPKRATPTVHGSNVREVAKAILARGGA